MDVNVAIFVSLGVILWPLFCIRDELRSIRKALVVEEEESTDAE